MFLDCDFWEKLTLAYMFRAPYWDIIHIDGSGEASVSEGEREL